jgi:hypothetical protein
VRRKRRWPRRSADGEATKLRPERQGILRPTGVGADLPLRSRRALGQTLLVAEVDPDDDTINRFIVWWYRFDPARHERRNTTVAAFDNEPEFMDRIEALSDELRRLKAAGLAEAVELVGGVHHPAGYGTKVRTQRERLRMLRKPGANG